MKTNIIKEFNNKELLEEICAVYEYEVKYDNDSVFCIVEGGDKNDEDTYTYENVELALVDWLDTLIESEELYRLDNVDVTWIEEINYIKGIKADLLFNSNSNILDESLVYGGSA